MAAVVAALDVAAERRGAAVSDRRHDLELAEAEMSRVGARIGVAVNAQDIRNLQCRPRHGRQAGGACPVRLTPRRSRGLVTSRIVLTATRV